MVKGSKKYPTEELTTAILLFLIQNYFSVLFLKTLLAPMATAAKRMVCFQCQENAVQFFMILYFPDISNMIAEHPVEDFLSPLEEIRNTWKLQNLSKFVYQPKENSNLVRPKLIDIHLHVLNAILPLLKVEGLISGVVKTE